jgi:pyruvate dehydrogenase E2 component (dihydrolipoamide acetyltransferase)
LNVADFTLPELGENISTGDVLRVLVKAGDRLAKDQPVLELETDKATIEVPSSVEGTVGDIKVKPGDKVKVGQVILTVSDGGKAEAPSAASAGKAEGQEPKADRQEPKAERVEPQTEPRMAAADRAAARAEFAPKQAEMSTPAKTDRPAPGVRPARSDGVAPKAADARPARPEAEREKVVDINRGVRPAPEAEEPELPPAPAAPSVRRMARELGVDVNQAPAPIPPVASRSRTSRPMRSGWSRARANRAAPPSSRCPTSAAGGRSSGSRCGPCGVRPLSI